MITIEEIKNECRAIIAQAEKATPGPWNYQWGYSLASRNTKYELGIREDYEPRTQEEIRNDMAFVAASRSFTPRAAKALLYSIDEFQMDMATEQVGCIAYCRASQRLETIRRTWEESK